MLAEWTSCQVASFLLPSIPGVPDSLLPIKGTGGSGLFLPLIFLSDFLRDYIAPRISIVWGLWRGHYKRPG